MTRLAFLLVFLIFPTNVISADLKPADFTCDDIVRFSKDVEQLEPEKLLLLGQAYDQGQCVQQDFASAFKMYRRAVERGFSVLGLRLGYLYLNGLGTERNDEKARYWFRSRALAHYYQQDEVLELLMALEFFGDPIPEMMRQEIRRARQESKGSPEVLMRNYRDLLTGNGVFPSTAGAILWLFMASKRGHPEADYDLAKRYLSGDGVSKSEMSYEIHLREAARGNHAAAQKELGSYLLRSGRETFRIFDALVWLLRAQRNGEDVEEQVQAVEQLLDRKHRRWAREKANDFNFNP